MIYWAIEDKRKRLVGLGANMIKPPALFRTKREAQSYINEYLDPVWKDKPVKVKVERVEE